MRRVRVTRERRGERWERRSERKSDEPPLSHLSLLASRAVGRSLSVPSLTSQARFVPVHFVHSLTARMEWVTGGIKGYIDNSLSFTPLLITHSRLSLVSSPYPHTFSVSFRLTLALYVPYATLRKGSLCEPFASSHAPPLVPRVCRSSFTPSTRAGGET